jgi:hypothetical protein
VEVEAAVARQPVAREGEHHQQRRGAERAAQERDMQRRDPGVELDLDEHEARAPHQGEEQQLDLPAHDGDPAAVS